MDDSVHDGEEDFIFSEYAIDDTLDPLNRLLNYHASGFSLQRLVLLRDLNETVEFAGFKLSAQMIVPLLNGFTSDCEPVVRQMLVEQLPTVADYFVKNGASEGYEILVDKFLPIAFELLVDKNLEVAASALEALKKLAQFVHKEHVHQHLLTVVVLLAHDERAEDYRVEAAKLFNELAPVFGRDFCVRDVLSEVEMLAIDSNFSVRKEVGSNLGMIAEVIGPAAAETSVLPIFLNLCMDEIWGVRKACALSIDKMALCVSHEVRVSKLIPAYSLLLEDSSRWVRNATLDSMGKFLHSLHNEDVSPAFLKIYTDMAFETETGETEYSEPCARSFPAVVQLLGSARWEELSDAYATLLKDVKWRVRRSLAHSLHEVALILGQEIAEGHLVPVFELLLRDLDEVRIGVVLHADTFLAVVGQATRERLIPILCNVPLESENWRLRNVVAQRIGGISSLLNKNSSAALKSVVTLVARLLDDSVMEVRRSTCKSSAILLKRVIDEEMENNCGGFVETLTQLAERHSFRGRLMFPYVCSELVKIGGEAIAEKHFVKGLLQLASDSVSNVRIAVRVAVQALAAANPRFLEVDRHMQVFKALAEKEEPEPTPPPVPLADTDV